MNVTHIRRSQDNLAERLQIIEENTENNKAAITIVNDELTKYKKKHDTLQKSIHDLESETQKLSSVIEKQDEQARRQNMMFFGVKENDRETWDITEQKIRELLENTVEIPNAKSKDELQIDRAQRVGQRAPNRTRPILVRFSQEKVRSIVFEQARKKLRDTDIPLARILVNVYGTSGINYTRR
jgi:chromosome segregation ATPase